MRLMAPYRFRCKHLRDTASRRHIYCVTGTVQKDGHPVGSVSTISSREANMAPGYSELVVEGPFTLVRGFLMGYCGGLGRQPRYYLHHSEGIGRHTLEETRSEVYCTDNLTYLCLEDSVLPGFLRAVARTEPEVNLSVRSVRRIGMASCDFAYETEAAQGVRAFRRLFSGAGAGLRVVATRHGDLLPFVAPDTLDGDSVWRARGRVLGSLQDVLGFVRRCRQSFVARDILLGEVELQLEGLELRRELPAKA